MTATTTTTPSIRAVTTNTTNTTNTMANTPIGNAFLNTKTETTNIWNDDNASTGSADSSNTSTGSTCHECSTTTGVLNSNLLLSTSEELLQQTFRWMFWSPQHLVKDDVFLAPLVNIDIKQIDDTTTPLTSTTTIPTPCLSPVTSPSDFLYDHEPLFDGINYELFDQTESGNESDLVSKKKIEQKVDHCCNNSKNDLDWSALSIQFSSDPYDDYDDLLPPTPSTTIEEEQEIDADESLDEFEDDDDDSQDGYKEIVTTKIKRKSLKRRPEEPMLLFTSKKPKYSSLTVFETLTQSCIDWCRYCGTTEGVNWRPGPWGKRTLCNKHGCDYKGYGLASRLPRLDLSAFAKEKLEDRHRPIVQQFCVICQCPEKTKDNRLVSCQGGCSRAYHKTCYPATNTMKLQHTWYCSSTCQENRQRNRVVVNLPRKFLPLMRLQRQQNKSRASS